MKFDFIIGNPPYDENTNGKSTDSLPLYDKFIDGAYKLSKKVELIHPAKWIFGAGKTPKDWNKKMLKDSHLKKLLMEFDSEKIFRDVSIEGGVVITYRDLDKCYEPIADNKIGIYIHNPILANIVNNVVVRTTNFDSIMPIIFSRTSYRLTDKLLHDYPEVISLTSNGHAKDMSTNIFETLLHIFSKEKPTNDEQYISIYGRINKNSNDKGYMWIKREYVKYPENFDYYKIILPKSYGADSIDTAYENHMSTFIIGQPLLCNPHVGTTETYISIGKFSTKYEAHNAMKYIKSKFARCLLGVLKVTPDNPPEKWKYVPNQDFTKNSDINWSKSISEIDKQLYKKYGLTEEDINFIETHIKNMK